MLRAPERYDRVPSIRRTAKLAAWQMVEIELTVFGAMQLVGRTANMVGSTSGAQKTACSSKVFSGSAGKREPHLRRNSPGAALERSRRDSGL